MKIGTINGIELKTYAYATGVSSVIIIMVWLFKRKVKTNDDFINKEDSINEIGKEKDRTLYNNSITRRYNRYYKEDEVKAPSEKKSDTIENDVTDSYKKKPLVQGSSIVASGLTVYYVVMTLSDYYLKI